MPPPQIYVEKTLAIIKPDIVDKEEEIQDIILRSGFTIVQVTSGQYDHVFFLSTELSEILHQFSPTLIEKILRLLKLLLEKTRELYLPK